MRNRKIKRELWKDINKSNRKNGQDEIPWSQFATPNPSLYHTTRQQRRASKAKIRRAEKKWKKQEALSSSVLNVTNPSASG
jgi:hypothetical protein